MGVARETVRGHDAAPVADAADPAGPRQPKTPKRVSDRDAFILEYLKDRNGTQAAIRAGYSPRSAHVTASRLLRNAKVRHALRAAEAKFEADTADAIERLALSREKALARLAQIAFCDIRAIFDLFHDERGVHDKQADNLAPKRSGISIKSFDQLPEHAMCGIAELSQNERGFRIRFADRRKALMDLARLMGWIEEERARHPRRSNHTIKG